MIKEITKPDIDNIDTKNWQKMIDLLNKSFRGFNRLSLLNDWNDNEPAIVFKSLWEINGAYMEAEEYEGITGWQNIPNEKTCWIIYNWKTNVFEYTITPPEWNGLKQGWYLNSNRYFYSLYKDVSGKYTLKRKLTPTKSNILLKTNYLEYDNVENWKEATATNVFSTTLNSPIVITENLYSDSPITGTTLTTGDLQSWSGAMEIDTQKLVKDGINWTHKNMVAGSLSSAGNWVSFPEKGLYWLAAGNIVSNTARYWIRVLDDSGNIMYDGLVPNTIYSKKGSDIQFMFKDYNSLSASGTMYFLRMV